MHHCWYRLASARVAEIHANSFIRTPYADVYSRQILASMVEEAWSGSIAKVDGSFQVISPSLCLGTCFSTGKCCFIHWKTATLFFSSSDWLPWDKLNQTVFVGKLLSLGDRYNSVWHILYFATFACVGEIAIGWCLLWGKYGSSSYIASSISKMGVVCKIGAWDTSILTARISQTWQETDTAQFLQASQLVYMVER